MATSTERERDEREEDQSIHSRHFLYRNIYEYTTHVDVMRGARVICI